MSEPDQQRHAEILSRHRIYDANWRRTKSGREYVRIKAAAERERKPKQTAAKMAVGIAIRNGTLVKPICCSLCLESPVFADGRSGIQAHHEDYGNPLEVVWLCYRCHADVHAVSKQKIIRTHCVSGHPFDENNTRYVGLKKECRACDRLRWQKRKEKVRGRK
jgi:hypothetical protein